MTTVSMSESISIVDDVKYYIDESNEKLKDIRKKIKLNDYNLAYYKNDEKNLLYKIAKSKVLMLTLDNNFMTRNMIRTQMCPKVLKGKECKYDECTFAHVVTDIRKAKCLDHIHNICSYGNRCKHDHSNSKLPEIPINYTDDIIPIEERC